MTEKEIKDYYKELLSFELKELQANEKKAREILEKHLLAIPNGKLYKYRKCNEKNFELLKNRQIYIAKPAEFPDKFDFTLKFDLDKNKSKIEKWVRENLDYVIYHSIRQYCTNNHIDFPYNQDFFNEVRNTCYTKNGKPIKEQIKLCLLKHGIKKDLDKKTKEIENYSYFWNDKENIIKGQTEKICEQWTKASQYARDNFYVYCMAESFSIDIMWQNYAGDDNGKYTGYCIEYDFSKALERTTKDWFNDWGRLLALVPMIYKQKKGSANIIPLLDASIREYFEKDKNYLHNISLRTQLNLMLLTKKKEYECEREWRMIIDKKTDNQFIDFPYVSAIYLGKDIAKEDEQKLLDIAKEIGIKAYKQILNFFNTDYIYEEIKGKDE